MSIWEIYWLTRMGSISTYLLALSVIIGIIGVVAAIISLTYLDESQQHWRRSDEKEHKTISGKKWRKRALTSVIGSVVVGFLCMLVPTRNDLAIMYAGSWATNNAEVTKLPENVAKTMNKFMEQYVQPEKEAK